jgi:ribonuclease BN (tRNA processing enzyme)
MQILFLGTGSGRVSLERNNTSLLFADKKTKTLIDCGEGIARAVLQQNIFYDDIDSIIFSHFHADHAAGLPGLITQMKLAGRKHALDIFVQTSLGDHIKNILDSFYVFSEGIQFPVNIIEFNSGEAVSINKNLVMKGVRNSHIINKYNIDYIPAEKFTSCSFLFSTAGKNIFYTADAGSGDDLFLFDEKIDFIITEATHIPPEKFIQALVRYEPEKIFLTHIDDEIKIEHWLGGLDKKIRKYFMVTYDGMELDV